MMVELVNALSAATAMRNPRKFVVLTDFASFLSDSIGVIKKFLSLIVDIGSPSHLLHIIFDSDGLKIAPKAHEYIEISEETHVECLSIIQDACKNLSIICDT